MQDYLIFTGGPLDGKSSKFSKFYNPYVVYEDSLYMVVYEGYLRVASHYRYVGKTSYIKDEDFMI
jgi:hypothetical protein